MNLNNIITGICSLMFFMIGADKFLNFLEPPCSLMSNIPSSVWSIFGIMQLAAGVLIWLPKFRKPVALFFMLFMTVFTVYHLTQSTYDIGGSSFMAVLLGLLVWNPKFIQSKKSMKE